MKNALLLLGPLCLGACSPVEPAVDATEVSGVVYRAGQPAEGVSVRLRGGFLQGSEGWTGTDVTDSAGRYTISLSQLDGGRCAGGGIVDVPRRSREERRLYAVEEHVQALVECGEVRSGVDFHFPRDFWYGRVSQHLHYDAAAADSVSVKVDSTFRVHASFEVRDSYADGFVHADSVEWVWGGRAQFAWQFDSTVLADATAYGGDDVDLTFVWLHSLSPGATPVVATVRDGPFADTIRVRVDPP